MAMSARDMIDQWVDGEVERLFAEHPPIRGAFCTNPITGGHYIGIEDPTEEQKRDARLALRTRQWFAQHGPRDAQPLPLSVDEIDDKYRPPPGRNPALHFIVCKYAASLRCCGYDYDLHPSFAEFAAGLLFYERAQDFVRNDEEMRKRYPPHRLRSVENLSCVWVPSKAEIARRRRALARKAA
jgi:hypothetical protein